jgi:hypothetical protein
MYVVQNANVFTAAFSGALAGMGAGRILRFTNPTAYSAMVGVANAFAQSLDAQWGVTAVGALEVEVIEEASQGIWLGRSQSNPSPALLNPSAWSQETQAIIAMVQEALALYLAQGYTNPPVGGGSNPFTFLQRVDCSVNSAYVESPFSATPVIHAQPGGHVAGGFNGGGVGSKGMLGFRVGNGLPLGSLASIEWTWQQLNPLVSPLTVYANLICDVNGDGSAYKVLVIDPASLPGLNNGTTVTNGDGSKTTTWLASENVLVVLGLPVPPLPPGGPGFVPPTVPGGPLPGSWPSNSYSIADILGAYPNAKLAEAASGDGGLPKSPNKTPPLLLVVGDSTNNLIQAYKVSDVKFNGVAV